VTAGPACVIFRVSRSASDRSIKASPTRNCSRVNGCRAILKWILQVVDARKVLAVGTAARDAEPRDNLTRPRCALKPRPRQRYGLSATRTSIHARTLSLPPSPSPIG
jgi:hypothetical protein